MNRSLTRLVGRGALAVVLLASGIHIVLSLFWWEWQRAAVVGIAFVAALVVGAALVVLDRIERLERRLEGTRSAWGQALPTTVAAGDVGGPPAPEPTPNFPWLSDDRSSDARVFVPIMLAAGLVVSVLASLVERVASALHRPRPGAAPPPSLPRRALPYAALVLVLGLGTLVAWQVSHYWGEVSAGGTTRFAVQVEVQKRVLRPMEITETVGRFCALGSGIGVRVVGVEPRSRDSAVLVVEPLLDGDAQFRFTGCLEDFVLERHRVHVLSVELAPTQAAGVQPAGTVNR